MATQKFTQALLWCDLESTDLDIFGNFVLEAAFLLTDMELKPFAAVHEVVTPTAESMRRLTQDAYVLEMHRKNGLVDKIKDVANTRTLVDIEMDVIKMIREKTAFSEGEISLAGSGVASFDRIIIRRTMPELDKWLTYWSYDVGQYRRWNKLFGRGRDVIEPVPKSFQDGEKAHRALDDVQAHLLEGQRYAEWFESVAPR